MPTFIDLQSVLTTRLQADGKKSNLLYYNFDFSGLTVSTQSIAFSSLAVTMIAPTSVDQDSYDNCTSSPVTVNFSLEGKATKSFEWSFDTSVVWSSAVSASVDIPHIGGVNGQRSVTVDLSAASSGAISEEVTKTRAHTLVIQPCRRLDERMILSEAKYSGDVTVTLLVSGMAGAYLDVDNAWDPWVKVLVHETITVTGKYTAVGGQTWNVVLSETAAQCPSGTPCSKGGGQGTQVPSPPGTSTPSPTSPGSGSTTTHDRGSGELGLVEGIDQVIAARLAELGVDDLGKLSKVDPSVLKVKGVSPDRLARWRVFASLLLAEPALEPNDVEVLVDAGVEIPEQIALLAGPEGRARLEAALARVKLPRGYTLERIQRRIG